MIRSDAVAGVVNLIFKNKLEGFTASVQGGISSRGDDGNYLASMGWAFDVGDDDRLHVDATSDSISQASGFLLGNPKPLSAAINVKEGFFETGGPLARDLPFARALDLHSAVRVTNYDLSGTEVMGKAGLTTNRHPGCGCAAPAHATFARRISTGAALRGLQLSADYYNIEINQAITTLAGQDIVDRCEAGSTSLCQYVARSGAGVITSVTQAYIDLASIKERGLDLETDYTLPFDRFFETASGKLNFRFLATHVSELRTSDGINNLFNANPPLDPPNFIIAAATNVALYDVVGRTFTAGVRVEF